MLSFLFWNLAKNSETASYVGRLGLTYTIDAFFLAECPENVSVILAELNQWRRGVYRLLDQPPGKVRVISRLPPERLRRAYTSISDDVSVWRLEGNTFPLFRWLWLIARPESVVQRQRHNLGGLNSFRKN